MIKIKNFRLTPYEKKNYVMKDRNDFIILSKVKKLEKTKLNKNDKQVLKLIKDQLSANWRRPLIIYLNKLSNKYQK